MDGAVASLSLASWCSHLAIVSNCARFTRFGVHVTEKTMLKSNGNGNGNGSGPTVQVLRQALAVASHTEFVCLVRRQLELLGEIPHRAGLLRRPSASRNRSRGSRVATVLTCTRLSATRSSTHRTRAWW